MSGGWDEYSAKRAEIIEARQRQKTDEDVWHQPDAHRKSGCYDCDAVWFGDKARQEAEEHQIATGHNGFWFIDSVG